MLEKISLKATYFKPTYQSNSKTLGKQLHQQQQVVYLHQLFKRRRVTGLGGAIRRMLFSA